MATNVEEFTIKLNQQIAGPAAEATSSLAQLDQMIQRERTALGELEGKLATAAAKLQTLGQGSNGSVSIAAIRKQQQAVADLQAQIDKKGAGIGKLEGLKGLAGQADALKKTGDAAGFSESKMHALVSSAQVAGGSMGGMAGRAQQLITGLSKGGLAGAAVLAAVAIVALAAALVHATIELAKWAVGLADAARNQALTNEGLAASYESLANLGSILPSVQASTGLATAELQKMAESLAKAGVSAAQMPDALRAIATATAGGASADFIAELEAGLKATGKVPAELAEQMSKFEAIAAKKMLSLDAQSETLKRNMSGVFGGLKIEGLLGGLAKLVALFDKNTAAGKTVKFLFEKMFQPLIDGVVAAIPMIERGFIIMLTWVLKAYIAIKQFANSDIGQGLITGLKILAVVLGVVVAIVVAGAALLSLPFVLMGAAIVAVVAAVGWMVNAASGAWSAIAGAASSAWAAVKGAIAGAVAWLSSLSLADIGKSIITGLANGILGAGGAVLSAITGAVGGAINAAKSMLGIHSPSKVFAQIGMHTAAGMAEGVDAGAPDAKASVSAMVAPPASKGATTGGGKSGPSLEFNNCTFGGDLTRDTMKAWLIGILEQHALDAEPA